MDTSETDKLIQEWIDRYRYEDGKLYYKKCYFKHKIGKEVKLTPNKQGYLCFGYTVSKRTYKTYLVHRVIFAMFHRKLPKIIDHIDRNPLNNRIENLREATHQLNSFNSKIPVTNKSGFRGVCFDSNKGKWLASIGVHSKDIHLGLYDTKEEAYEARVAYEKKLNIHHIINPNSHAINN